MTYGDQLTKEEAHQQLDVATKVLLLLPTLIYINIIIIAVRRMV